MRRIKILRNYAGPRGVFQSGEILEMEDRDAMSWLSHGLGESVGEIPEIPRAERATLNWTLKTSPVDYLRRYPKGKKAPLARRVLDET